VWEAGVSCLYQTSWIKTAELTSPGKISNVWTNTLERYLTVRYECTSSIEEQGFVRAGVSV
jgi:hypothetical protein